MLNLLRKRGVNVDPMIVSEMIADNESLEKETESLIVKVGKLQKENHYLRRANKVKPHLRIVVRAEAAARLLALWHCSGYRTGRPAAASFGMSETTYYAGRALLRVARLWDDDGWRTDDPAIIESKLKVAVERCKDRPDLLVYRLPLSRRPKTLKPD